MGSLSSTGAGQTLTMRHIASFLVLALVPLSLGKPGMLTWICKTCRNPTMIYTAEAQINAGDGAPVGQLRLVQHVTRDDESGVAGPVMIDTVDNRETCIIEDLQLPSSNSEGILQQSWRYCCQSVLPRMYQLSWSSHDQGQR